MNLDVNFPEGFYQVGKRPESVIISEDEINEWIRECLDDLENNKKNKLRYISSGDTKVIVKRSRKSEINDEYYYIITVAKNYWSKDIGF